ncbi:MAG: response regulator transcription factor [Chitinophagaceae bacterium]|nr:response regulator transcription factor [Chitinophagaceae bacterium]
MNREIAEYKVALVDDHILIRIGLAKLVNGFEGCQVTIEASTGEELLSRMSGGTIPDIIILDLNMPGIGGRETAARLQKNFPDIPVLILSMYDTEITLVQLVNLGVKGFLKKDVSPTELRFAFRSIMQTGHYLGFEGFDKLVEMATKAKSKSTKQDDLEPLEVDFLKMVCTELTYRAIASEMGLKSHRVADRMRDNLFNKLEIKTRVGLALYAVKSGIVKLNR